MSTRTPCSSVSYSSTAPTSVRSEVALPPTATAWSGFGTSTSSKKSSMWSRSLRISLAEGGSCWRKSSVSAPEPILNDFTQWTPLATVPTMISQEPPPTSTTPMSPSTGCPRVLVAPTSQATLLFLGEHFHVHP